MILKVSFYKGFQYNAAKVDPMKVFKNAADTEPPKESIPAGETALVSEELSKITTSDDEYLVTDSDTQFPYHRFDVTLDSSVDEFGYCGIIMGRSFLRRQKSLDVCLEP